ncbi:hypothetical protein [Paracoccus versutus]
MSKGSAFEKKVREYAAIRFGLPFKPEHLAGVNYDCVASPKLDYKIIIEATVNHSLEKVRGDIARLQIVKQKLIAEGVYVEAYIVLEKEPTNFMQEGGKSAKIEVVSFESFYRSWYDVQAYTAARLQRPFGSAFREGISGPDERPYVPVFFDDADGRRYSIDALADLIKGGRKAVLTGDFGTGKSRSIQQLFTKLMPQETGEKSPVSIDLRHMWGTTSAEEVLRRHYSMLQLGAAAEKVSDALHHNEFYLLLDGFDELAIQEWGSDPDAVAKSRARTMEPVRDLLSRTTNGALVTGRAHYFNSDAEMLSALGLPSTTIILSTPPEFSLSEVGRFMKDMGYKGDIPVWLPRKPLVAEMYCDFSNSDLISDGSTRAAFWENFIDALCRRDSKIRQSYDPEAIKQILCRLSRRTRALPNGNGPIVPSDIQEAFTSVVGQLPAQEASSMLQRLPGLGRVSSETEDRQFIDDFIIQGLRGLDVSTIIATYEVDAKANEWRHGAGELGIEIIASRSGAQFSKQYALNRMRGEKAVSCGQLNADIASGLLLAEDDLIDFGGAEVVDGSFSSLDLSNIKVRNLTIASSDIRFLNLYNSDVSSVSIVDCLIENLDGVSADGLPSWINKCSISNQTQLDTVARIKKSQLKPAEMILVNILRKVFFQPGNGRKEEALLRGLGQYGDAKMQGKVISILQSRSFISEFPGDSGKLYIPERSKMARAGRMISQLQQSTDEVWLEVSNI